MHSCTSPFVKSQDVIITSIDNETYLIYHTPMAAKVTSLPERFHVAGKASMVPGVVVPPPPKTVEVIPSLADLIKVPKDYLAVSLMIQESLEAAAAERLAKKIRASLTAKLKNFLGIYEISKAILPGVALVTYSESSRSSVNPAKLLNQGVSPEVIAACTDVTAVYTLKITQGDEVDAEN